jgi:hypothetical protein
MVDAIRMGSANGLTAENGDFGTLFLSKFLIAGDTVRGNGKQVYFYRKRFQKQVRYQQAGVPEKIKS